MRKRRVWHFEERNKFQSTPNIRRVIKSKGMKTSGYVERMGEKRIAYGVWLEIPVKREYLEDPRRRWETNIKYI